MPPITIRELAVLAGCSHVTVSLALRSHPRIPKATREKICNLAHKHGYVRDPLVSSLMNKLRTSRRKRSTEKIAYLSWGEKPDASLPQPASTWLGARERAAELGYEMEEFWAAGPDFKAKHLSRILHTRGIRGVLLAALSRPVGHVSLNWSQFAAVALGYTVVKPDLHRVIHSHFQGMTLAFRNLRHSGYRRIGFVGLQEQLQGSNQGWLAAYLLGSYKLPENDRLPPLFFSQWNRLELKRWIHQYRPDAVISNADTVLDLMREAGYLVPRKIGFASLDRMKAASPYAGVDQMRRQMGSAGADLLVSLLESHQYGLPKYPKILHFDGVWHNGPTIRKTLKTL